MSFVYSLRYTLDPRTNTPEKDAALMRFVKEARIDNVAFFINPEELNNSHLTAAQTQVWLDAIKPLQAQLAKMGVTTSLNPWTTMMHSDRGQTVNPAIGFDTLVDINGKKAASIACPGDPKWRDYLAARYAQYATIHPQELWLEDDFRHYNHTPLKLGCFCPRHMALYTQALGRDISRAAFVQEMLQPGEPTPARSAYLSVARQEMIETVHEIEQAVHAVAPDTNLAQMTSFPDWHAIEGRDWAGLFDAERGTGHPRIARPHLPAYNEIAPLKYGRAFEDYTRTTAAYLGDQADFYPELENYMYSPFVKSRRFTQFQIETAALVGAKGILLNLFDMMGNGIDESYGYAQMLAESRDFLDKVSKRRLQMSQTRGIQVLVDQDSSFTIHTTLGKGPEELLPKETSWAGLLSMFGFSTTITPWQSGTRLDHQLVAVSGQLLRNMDDEAIRELLGQHRVILDGESAAVIVDRHLGDLLHIESTQWHRVRTGYQSYEEATGHTADGIENPRITMLQHTGDYLQVTYAPDANVTVWSHAYNQNHERLGNVLTVIDDHIVVMPMNADPKYGWESQYISTRQALYQQLLPEIAPLDYLVAMPNVKLNVITGEDGMTLWLANFTLDDYHEIVWHPAEPVAADTATLITREGTTTVPLIRREDGCIVIDHPLVALTMVQLVIQ
ncbi:hypothetical protein PQ472_11680 [Lacticaseibacillus pabuli]|uniref:Uncharacterized protein n=1 Tax=Lacticaseibacillus pabuli TaxID=3025672 RepID=A0ABY7WU62_9LACO|nr:hypothetical protein [Lacticaseibacillus sp. KACC 23028]WDF82536.1 hypothetical protein PQ472_11680 [Lacticaseibacillus sp. KACC 23028]